MPEKYHKEFASFWYYYLSQHMKTGTRALHYVGTWIAIIATGVAVTDQITNFFALGTMRWLLVPAGIITVYVLGFISHWTIEKNQPATFTYPLMSVGGDLYMFWMITTRQVKPHVEEIKRRLATGWVIDRYGFYAPEYAREHKLTSDRKMVPTAVA